MSIRYFTMKLCMLLVGVSLVSTCSIQPMVCTCYRQQTLAFCVDKNLNRPPRFPSSIVQKLKRLSLIGNHLTYLSREYVEQFNSIVSIDMRAQRVTVNCTLLRTLQNVRSDCARVQNSSWNTATPVKSTSTGQTISFLPSILPPKVHHQHPDIALSVGIWIIIVVILGGIAAKVKTNHKREQAQQKSKQTLQGWMTI